jgi:hypothetical protein
MYILKVDFNKGACFIKMKNGFPAVALPSSKITAKQKNIKRNFLKKEIMMLNSSN